MQMRPAGSAQGSGRRMRPSLGAGCMALFVLAAALGPGARAASLDVTFSTQEVRGVHGSFGFTIQYAPTDILVRPGGTVTLAYAPGPLPAALVVDVAALLASSGVDPPPAVDQVAALLPANVSVPITDTPIGRYTVDSIPIYSASGVSVTLDVTLDGQVNATLAADAGTLDRTALTWTGWGGQEATLTAPGAGSANVTASFAYYVSNRYVLAFDILGVPYTYPIAAFPLGELNSPERAESHIETVEPSAGAGAPGPAPPWTTVVVAMSAGIAVGLGVGWGVGRRSVSRGSGKHQRLVPPPPPPK